MTSSGNLTEGDDSTNKMSESQDEVAESPTSQSDVGAQRNQPQARQTPSVLQSSTEHNIISRESPPQRDNEAARAQSYIDRLTAGRGEVANTMRDVEWLLRILGQQQLTEYPPGTTAPTQQQVTLAPSPESTQQAPIRNPELVSQLLAAAYPTAIQPHQMLLSADIQMPESHLSSYNTGPFSQRRSGFSAQQPYLPADGFWSEAPPGVQVLQQHRPIFGSLSRTLSGFQVRQPNPPTVGPSTQTLSNLQAQQQEPPAIGLSNQVPSNFQVPQLDSPAVRHSTEPPLNHRVQSREGSHRAIVNVMPVPRSIDLTSAPTTEATAASEDSASNISGSEARDSNGVTEADDQHRSIATRAPAGLASRNQRNESSTTAVPRQPDQDVQSQAPVASNDRSYHHPRESAAFSDSSQQQHAQVSARTRMQHHDNSGVPTAEVLSQSTQAWVPPSQRHHAINFHSNTPHHQPQAQSSDDMASQYSANPSYASFNTEHAQAYPSPPDETTLTTQTQVQLPDFISAPATSSTPVGNRGRGASVKRESDADSSANRGNTQTGGRRMSRVSSYPLYPKIPTDATSDEKLARHRAWARLMQGNDWKRPEEMTEEEAQDMWEKWPGVEELN